MVVKIESNDSRQGEKEFLAGVQMISQLWHRNVVELTGFCRHRGKFLLVYELLSRGSLDQALFKLKSPEDVLSWSQRWKIVSGTAAAPYYLHQGWRQQVIHRDVKSSNSMLDDSTLEQAGGLWAGLMPRRLELLKHTDTVLQRPPRVGDSQTRPTCSRSGQLSWRSLAGEGRWT